MSAGNNTKKGNITTIPGYNAYSNNETKKTLNPPFLRKQQNLTKHSQWHCQHITTARWWHSLNWCNRRNDDALFVCDAIGRDVKPSRDAASNWECRQEHQTQRAQRTLLPYFEGLALAPVF
jgi:hypothetical protein